MEWDVFISHAREDKEAIARPLADGLRARGITVWFDEFALTVGDSLRRSIDHGLAQSRFGIVVISKNFLRKEWPQKELDGLVAREVDGIKVILPVWHEIGAAEIRSYSPFLADRLAASSDKGLDHVIEELIRAIRRDHPAPRPEDKPAFPASPPEATPHAPTADEIADVLERRLRVARAGDGPYSQLTNAELRKHVIEITQKMRKLEREQRAQSILHDLNLSDEQKRAATIEDYLEMSQRHVAEYETTLFTDVNLIYTELLRRVEPNPPDPRTAPRWAARIPLALRFPSLSGASPLSDSARYLEQLAARLPL